MDFIKLQATGNDFVLIDARRMKRDWSALAKAMCPRNFGVGADGLLLILPSKAADFYMRMFNPDGSEAEACGNGLRCAARYAKESGLVSTADIRIETPTGIKVLWALDKKNIRVAMGKPILAPSAIPVLAKNKDAHDTSPVIDYPLTVSKMKLKITCVSVGNPHAVCFLDQPVNDFPLAEVGPKVEHHSMFPNRVNFEIVNVISRSKLRARVWERGVGETLSCGTGACAIAVASKLKKLTDNPVDIILPGGTLTVDWDGKGEVLLSGPAEIVFEGKWIGLKKSKEQQEKDLINHFLKDYNETTKAQYDLTDKKPDKNNQTKKQPDFVCKDAVTGEKMVVEISRLRGPIDWQWEEGASKFLGEVSSQLEGKLPGTFLLLPDVERIEFNQKNKKPMQDRLCEEILELASSLAVGEEATVREPFDCRLKKYKEDGSQLGTETPYQALAGPSIEEMRYQFEQVLDEANEKFRDYSDLITILLLGIWETSVCYDKFVSLLPIIDMSKYENVKHVYLYNASPDTRIYHLWPTQR